MLDNIRIVLVRTIRPGNLGAVCRVMKNMGLSDLVLVRPECALDDPQAVGYAARAKEMLSRARVTDTLADALAGCVRTFAATGKGGMYRKQAGLTATAAAELAMESAAQGRVAIAFGPEDHGLVMKELLEFDRVIEISAAPEYPVMNLAAAATVICHEVRQAWLRRENNVASTLHDEPPATDDRRRIFHDKLFAALEMVGFFGGQQNPDHLKFALRRIFGRIDLTMHEVDVLIGMAQQIRWYAERFPRNEPGA